MRQFTNRSKDLAADVAFLSQTHLDTMVEKGTVLRAQLLDDGAGSSTTTYLPVRSTFNTPCYRSQHKEEDLSTIGGRLGTENEYDLILPVGTDITAGDQFKFSFGPMKNVTYDVVNVYDLTSEVTIQTVYIRLHA